MTSERPSPSGLDWHAAVRQKAELTGADLPHATIDELALHLEDLYGAALAEGAAEDHARVRAFEALDASSLRVLTARLPRDPRRLQARQADDAARAATGGSLQMTTAIRMALRQFRQHPSFALITILVLGLGVGAATTIYTIVESVVLRPLPYSEPDWLVTIWDTNVGEARLHDPISPVNFSDQRERDVFEDAAAWWRPGVNLIDPGIDPVRVNTIEVSGNLFDLLGVRPQIGAGLPAARFLSTTSSLRSSATGCGARATAPTRPSSASNSASMTRPIRSWGSCPPASTIRTTSTSGSGCAGT